MPRDESGASDIEMTTADRSIIEAINTAQASRKGIATLRAASLAVALFAIVGNAFNALDYSLPTNPDSLFVDPHLQRQQWAIFLTGVATPLGLAALLFAASFLLAVHCSRLEMDVVIAEQNESDEPSPA
jgi:hypothetical protein